MKIRLKERLIHEMAKLRHWIGGLKTAKAQVNDESRPSFIIEIARRHLKTSAELIGAIVERKRAGEALRRSKEELSIRKQIADIFLTVPDDQMYAERGIADHSEGYEEQVRSLRLYQSGRRHNLSIHDQGLSISGRFNRLTR